MAKSHRTPKTAKNFRRRTRLTQSTACSGGRFWYFRTGSLCFEQPLLYSRGAFDQHFTKGGENADEDDL